jgi:hypothetical protein
MPVLQAERQKAGQEPEYQIGYKARVNQNHLNGTTAPSRKSFPALFAGLSELYYICTVLAHDCNSVVITDIRAHEIT